MEWATRKKEAAYEVISTIKIKQSSGGGGSSLEAKFIK